MLGIFFFLPVAPVHGLYIFTLNFITGDLASTNLDIMVNDVRKCVAFGDGAHRHTTGVCTLIVELQPGDKVHVEHEDPHEDGGTVWGGDYTRFNGYLIKAL